jgi:hypothetical protein
MVPASKMVHAAVGKRLKQRIIFLAASGRRHREKSASGRCLPAVAKLGLCPGPRRDRHFTSGVRLLHVGSDSGSHVLRSSPRLLRDWNSPRLVGKKEVEIFAGAA